MANQRKDEGHGHKPQHGGKETHPSQQGSGARPQGQPDTGGQKRPADPSQQGSGGRSQGSGHTQPTGGSKMPKRDENAPSQGATPRDPMEFPRKPNEPSRGEPRAQKDSHHESGGEEDDNR